VTILLPFSNAPAAGEEPDAPAAAVSRAGVGQTVLVVDDEPAVRMLITEVLGDLGYESLQAADGAAGLALLAGAPHVDLLVTDIGLQGAMNGRQVAAAARRLAPGLKILFITGYAESSVAGAGALEAGMHILTKPFSLDALAQRIEEILRG
jgi:CheY-like chemotaxis protein